MRNYFNKKYRLRFLQSRFFLTHEQLQELICLMEDREYVKELHRQAIRKLSEGGFSIYQ